MVFKCLRNILNLHIADHRSVLNNELCKEFDPLVFQDVKKSAILYILAFTTYSLTYGVDHYQLYVFFALLMLLSVWPMIALCFQSITLRTVTYRIVLTVMIAYAVYYTGGITSPFLILTFFLAMTVLPHSVLLLSSGEKVFGLICAILIVVPCIYNEYYAFFPPSIINFAEQPFASAIILLAGVLKVDMVEIYHKKAIYSYHQNLTAQLDKHKRLVQNANLNLLVFDADNYEIKNFSPSAKIFTAYYHYNIDSFKDHILERIEVARQSEGSHVHQIHLNINGECHYFELVTEYYRPTTDPESSFQKYENITIKDEIYCLIYDVTNRVNYEKSIIDARDRAVELYKSKSSFLAQMSHELRTPLNAIIGFSEVMSLEMLGDMPNAYKEYSKNINQSGQYLLTIVNDILDMAWIESGKYDPYVEKIDITETLKHVMAVTCHLAEKKNIKIHLDQRDHYNQELYSDIQALKQILINIISNSVKYCPTNSEVHVSFEYTNNQLIFHVQDNGNGFSDTVLQHFGDPFNIDKDHLVDGQKSTGLGLSITKGLTEVLGGEVYAFNAPQGGAVVRITLPNQPDFENNRSKKNAA